MQRRYYRGCDFRRARTIEELRVIARRRLPGLALEYLEGAAEDEITLRRNREVFEKILFLPRTLIDVGKRELSTQLFGRTILLPLVIGPTALNGMLCHGADLALARAARKHGIPFTLSTISTSRIEDVVAQGEGCVWFQIYNMRDRDFWKRLVHRAAAAGCETLVITTDVPVFGNREWDMRNYRALGKPSLRSMLDVLAHPRWLLDVMVLHGQPRFANLRELLPPGHDRASEGALSLSKQIDPTLNWGDVAMLRDLWQGKLVIKGVLNASDAEIAARHGVDGIVLTNHGGRQLDGAVSPMDVLAEVHEAVGERLTVMIDSGFRRGSDVVKALALGAKAVLLGRAVLYGTAAGGEAGTAHALEILRMEIDRVLALLGCTSIQQLGPAHLRLTG
jgi:(S)-mandelate dehydrogenase